MILKMIYEIINKEIQDKEVSWWPIFEKNKKL